MEQDFTVVRYGTDSSGRAILMTAWMKLVWEAILDRPRVRPFADRIVIVQGAFMSRLGGGAVASAGYHDLAGSIDIRTWNLTQEEEDILWWEAALFGLILWKRDEAHGGMDEHGHGILVSDRPLASGAATQAAQAKARRDGLASNGPDYHPRPPWVDMPPAELLQEDDMFEASDRALLQRVLTRVDDGFKNERSRDAAERQREKDRHQQVITLLEALVDQLTEGINDSKDDATKEQLRKLKRQVLAQLEALKPTPEPDPELREVF